MIESESVYFEHSELDTKYLREKICIYVYYEIKSRRYTPEGIVHLAQMAYYIPTLKLID